MRLNLYIPTQQEKEEWEEFAQKDSRSLSSFIRQCVREKIERMRHEQR